MINAIDILKTKSNNTCNTLYERRKITSRGKHFWENIFNHTDWQRAWLLPNQFCITNKLKEVHVNILHSIYPTNLHFSKYKNTFLQWWVLQNCLTVRWTLLRIMCFCLLYITLYYWSLLIPSLDFLLTQFEFYFLRSYSCFSVSLYQICVWNVVDLIKKEVQGVLFGKELRL